MARSFDEIFPQEQSQDATKAPPTVDDYINYGKTHSPEYTKAWTKPDWEDEARGRGMIAPQNQKDYADWYNKTATPNDPEKSRESFNYNYPAYYNEYVAPGHTGKAEVSANGHFPDEHKFMWHPAASKESIYANDKAPSWEYQNRTSGKWEKTTENDDYAEARLRSAEGKIFAKDHGESKPPEYFNDKNAPQVEDVPAHKPFDEVFPKAAETQKKEPLQGHVSKNELGEDIAKGVGGLVQSAGQGIQAVSKDIASPEPIQNKVGAVLAGAGEGAISVPESIANLGMAAIHGPAQHWTDAYRQIPQVAAAQKAAPGLYGAGGLAGNIGVGALGGMGIAKAAGAAGAAAPQIGQAAAVLAKMPAVSQALQIVNRIPPAIRSVLVGTSVGSGYNAAGNAAEQYKQERRIHGHQVVQAAAGGAALGGGLSAAHAMIPRRQPPPISQAPLGPIAPTPQARFNPGPLNLYPTKADLLPEGIVKNPITGTYRQVYPEGIKQDTNTGVYKVQPPVKGLTYPGFHSSNEVHGKVLPPQGEKAQALAMPGPQPAQGQIPPAHKSAQVGVEPKPTPNHPPEHTSAQPGTEAAKGANHPFEAQPPAPASAAAQGATPESSPSPESKTTPQGEQAPSLIKRSFASETAKANVEATRKERNAAAEKAYSSEMENKEDAAPASAIGAKKKDLTTVGPEATTPEGEYTVGRDPDNPGYAAIFKPDGTIQSSSNRSLDKAQAVADKLNAGTLSKKQGQRETYPGGTPIASPAREDLFGDAKPLPENHELQQPLNDLAEIKNNRDEAEGVFRASYRELLDDAKRTPRTAEDYNFKYDRDLEKAYMEKNPDQIGIRIQGRYEYEPGKYKWPSGVDTGAEKEAWVNKNYKKFYSLDKTYDKTREALVEPLLKGHEEGSLPDVIHIKHPQGDIAVRAAPAGKSWNEMQREAGAEKSPGHIQYALKDIKGAGEDIDKYVPPEAAKQTKSLLTDPTVLHGLSFNPLETLAYAGEALKQAKEWVGKNSPRGKDTPVSEAFRMYTTTHLNSDKVEAFADPAFTQAYWQHISQLDTAVQGMEELTSRPQEDAWGMSRYDTPEKIRSGTRELPYDDPKVKGRKLTVRDVLTGENQIESLIKQNQAKDDFADSVKMYLDTLEENGYSAKGMNTVLPGGNNLASTLKIDLRRLDPRQFGERSDLYNAFNDVSNWLSSTFVHRIMTGNLPIAGLHAVEATKNAASMFKLQFARATGLLNTSDAMKGYVNSFDSSKDIMYHIQSESQGALGKHWFDFQKGAVNLAGKAFGHTDAYDELLENKGVRAAGNVMSGGALNQQGVHIARATALVHAADTLKYPGGAEALASDLTTGKNISPEKALEAGSIIMRDMSQMINFSPNGYTDMNFFQRAAERTTALVRIIAPLMSKRIQQARFDQKLLTETIDSFDKAAGEKDWGKKADLLKKGAAAFGTYAVSFGLLTLVGGRASVPKEMQDAIRGADPVGGAQLLDHLDDLAYISRIPFFGKDISQHLQSTIVPALHIPEPIITSDLNDLTKMFNANSDAFTKARGVAAAVAMLGITDFVGAMSPSVMVSYAQAIKDGLDKQQKAWLYADKGFGGTQAGAGQVSMGKSILKAAGAEVDDHSYAGKLTLPIDMFKSIYNAMTVGKDYTAERYIKEASDDLFAMEAVKKLDPVQFKRLYKDRYKKSTYVDWNIPPEGDKTRQSKIDAVESHLHFWRDAYTRIMKDKQQTEGKQHEEEGRHTT